MDDKKNENGETVEKNEVKEKEQETQEEKEKKPEKHEEKEEQEPQEPKVIEMKEVKDDKSEQSIELQSSNNKNLEDQGSNDLAIKHQHEELHSERTPEQQSVNESEVSDIPQKINSIQSI